MNEDKNYTLQRGSRNHNPSGWENVISGDSQCVIHSYEEFSHMCRCQDAFQVADSDGNTWDLEEFMHLAKIDASVVE